MGTLRIETGLLSSETIDQMVAGAHAAGLKAEDALTAQKHLKAVLPRYVVINTEYREE